MDREPGTDKGRTCKGLTSPADSPMLSSMYFLSSGEMVGWAAGLSYDTMTQKRYQQIPKLPGGVGGLGERSGEAGKVEWWSEGKERVERILAWLKM